MSGVRLMVVGMMAVMGAAPVAADSMWEVAHARANARAGGPISGYDAEMLERWGCLSGTRSAFCRRVARGGKPARRRAARRRSRR